jgi:hydroxymethylbilane synthase
MSKRIRIATRGSQLALWQAHHVEARLRAAAPEREIEIVPIETRGDQIRDVPLAKLGGKGLFIKAIEQALLDGRGDLAVHSMKDVPADKELEPSLVFAAVTERADPRDALVSRAGVALDGLPQGAHVGTASLRRMCMLKSKRPDLRVSTLRGNVPTRLQKLDAGEFDAIVLSAAGLSRLGFADRISEILDPEASIPAVGQGALGIQVRADDQALAELARAALHHPADARRIAAERAFLSRLEGGCQTPMAAYARYDGDAIAIDGAVGRPDGTEILRGARRGSPDDAEALGLDLADELLARGADAILRECIAAAEAAP